MKNNGYASRTISIHLISLFKIAIWSTKPFPHSKTATKFEPAGDLLLRIAVILLTSFSFGSTERVIDRMSPESFIELVIYSIYHYL